MIVTLLIIFGVILLFNILTPAIKDTKSNEEEDFEDDMEDTDRYN